MRSTCEFCVANRSAHDSKLALRDLQNQNRQVHVSSMHAEASTSHDGSKFTEYVFRCIATVGTESYSWDVRRRYSDFNRLHSHLRKKGEVLADLPAKNPFAMISAVVRSREISLTDYLNVALSRCNDDQCILLAKFLRVNKHLPSSTAIDAREQHIERHSCTAPTDQRG